MHSVRLQLNIRDRLLQELLINARQADLSPHGTDLISMVISNRRKITIFNTCSGQQAMEHKFSLFYNL